MKIRYQSLFDKQRHWAVFFAWLFLAIMCFILVPYFGKPFKIGDISDPRAESTLAQKTIEKELSFSGSRIFVLFRSEKLTANDPVFTSQVKKSLEGLEDLDFEYSLVSPYQNSQQIADDKHEAYAVIKTKLTTSQLANELPNVRAALGKPKKIKMYIGGEPSYMSDVYHLSENNLVRAELIALPICFIVMIFIFGGIIPALVTILSGIISVTVIIAILYVLGHYIDLTIFVLNIATILGLGLSLDYSLLITYRFREEFAKCLDCSNTINVTLGTGGIAIFFSGLIVLISIGSLIFFPINVLFSLGVAGIVVVAVTVLCALTFLPSVLCLLEKNVTGTIPQLRNLASEKVHEHRWYIFAKVVMRHPFLFLIPTIFVLLVLGYPFIHVKLNSPDARILPTWVESRKLLDQFNENFNPNEIRPIVLVFKSQNNSILTKNNISALYDYAKRLKDNPNIESVSSIVTLKPGLNKSQYQTIYTNTSNLPFDDYQKKVFNESTKGKYTVMSVVTKSSKDNEQGFKLVEKIRQDKMANNITKQVTGTSASVLDSIEIVYSLFLKLIIVISIVTYLALMWLLRSLILPLKAIIMNFLSLSVCYGMLVFIFQEGHFAHILSFTAFGYTDMNLPILLFFALFGLSMDYEVFLLTRMKEYYDQTGDNAESVALGIERSARIITSAALIVVIVSLAFVTADIVFIKAFGLATALAITVDASLIRLLLVPATMSLLGDWNWYIPKWLDKLLPVINFDRDTICKK